MRLRFAVALLVSLIVAWVVSGYMWVGVSYLNPIYLHIHATSQAPRAFALSYASDEQFSDSSHTLIDIEDEEVTVQIPIPAHKVGYMRVGFFASASRISLLDVRLGGRPLNIEAACHYQSRNIRECQVLGPGSIAVRTGGEEAYITLPPSQLEAAIPWLSLWWWRVGCFLFCLVGMLLLCWKFGQFAWDFLCNHYPTPVLSFLFVLLVYAYYAMRWQAFMPRLEAIFGWATWTEFLLLAQEHAWAPALLLGSACAAFMVKNKYLKIGIWGVGSIILVLEMTDSALLYLLNARFAPSHVQVFGADVFSTAWPFIKSFLSNRAGIYALLLSATWGVLGLYAWRHTLSISLKKVVCVFAVLGFVWYLMPAALTSSAELQLRDWPRLSLHSWWSTKHETAQLPDFNLTYTCTEGLNSQQNIVIVLIESLSSYMSNYFAGGQAESWTPHLDKLASQYVPFTNYRATNFDTTQALFSILTGFPAVYYFAESNLYREPKFYRRTMPAVFHKAGYHTAFLTSASFVYSKDYILQRIGFDEISSDTDPFYNGQKRFVFHSVADDVLYARAENWMETYNRAKPYFLVVETTTSHNPFVDPISGEESLEKTVRYADKALGDFIENLKKKNLLKNTLVVVTADHRVMRPLTEQQTNIFGLHAEQSIPFVLIGSPLHGKQAQQACHIDLAPSLEYLTLPQACFHPYQHNIFSSKQERDSCTIFQSFVEKDTVMVQCKDQYTKLCLFYQGSSVCQNQIGSEKINGVLSFINWIRDNNRY